MWCTHCDAVCPYCATMARTPIPAVGIRNSAPPEKYVRPSRRHDTRRMDRRTHPDIIIPNELVSFVTTARGSGIVVKSITESAKIYTGAKYDILLLAPPGMTVNDSVIQEMIDSTPYRRMVLSGGVPTKTGTEVMIRLGAKQKRPAVSAEDQAVIDMMRRKK